MKFLVNGQWVTPKKNQVIFGFLPVIPKGHGTPIIELLMHSGLTKSKTEGRKAIMNKSIKINDVRIEDCDAVMTKVNEYMMVVQTGPETAIMGVF